MNKFIEKLDNLILFFIIYTISFLIFFKTLPYTLPFVLAFLFALVLKKPANYLIKKLKIKNSLASFIVTLIFFSIIITLLFWGINLLVNEVIDFGRNAQAYLYSHEGEISNYVDNIYRYYLNLPPSIIDSIEKTIGNSFSKISNIIVFITSKIVSSFIGLLTSVPYILMLILFTLLSTYFFTKEITKYNNKISKIIFNEHSSKFSHIYLESKKMLNGYILSYLTLIGITFFETLIIFFIFNIKYSIMFSITAAIADFLPILGIGTIYVPLALIYILVYKNYVVGIGLLISYAAVSTIRQILEPKLLSSSLGLHPISILAAIFIGLKANGISGMFFCLFFIIFYNILRKVELL
ncbi:sporulation integral membrane protein YtvI [Clostridium botulinum]|nr:sporulation integral membrane protein YtvI [Clostridium botulinum]